MSLGHISFININEVILTPTNPVSYPCPHLFMKSFCNIKISPWLAPSISGSTQGHLTYTGWSENYSLSKSAAMIFLSCSPTMDVLCSVSFVAVPQASSALWFPSLENVSVCKGAVYFMSPLSSLLKLQNAMFLEGTGKIFPALPYYHVLFPDRSTIQSAQDPRSQYPSKKIS